MIFQVFFLFVERDSTSSSTPPECAKKAGFLRLHALPKAGDLPSPSIGQGSDFKFAPLCVWGGDAAQRLKDEIEAKAALSPLKRV